jgi:hypothetical protein
MRGREVLSGSLFSSVHPKARVLRSHPLRTIRSSLIALPRLNGVSRRAFSIALHVAQNAYG